jgi:hypothetical protein
MQKSQSVIYVFEDENNHEKPCDNDCHKPITPPGVVYPWVQECPPPKPIELCETSLTPLWIQSNSQDAVVRVYTQTALTSATTIGRTLPIYSGVEGQDATSSYDVYSTFGNGFIIAGGQIACPAHLVLLPPNLQIYNTYPITANNANAIANGNTVIPASLITVDVFNVNGCKSSFTYQAIILSVDGANDLAILAILTNNGVGPCSQMLVYRNLRTVIQFFVLIVADNIEIPLKPTYSVISRPHRKPPRSTKIIPKVSRVEVLLAVPYKTTSMSIILVLPRWNKS